MPVNFAHSAPSFSMLQRAVRASRGCHGAAFIMQRGCRRHATGAPLQPQEGLTARANKSAIRLGRVTG